MPWIAAAIGGSALIGGVSSFLGGQSQSAAADESANLQNNQYLQTRADLAPWRNSGVAALGQINALLGLGGSGPGGINPATATAPTATPLVGKLYSNQSGRGNTPIQDIQQALAAGIPVSDASWAQAGFGPGGVGYFPSTATGVPGASQTSSAGAVDPATARQNAIANFFADPSYTFTLDQGLKALQNSAAARGILNSGATAKAITQYGQGLASQQYGNYFNRLADVAGIGQAATNTTGSLGASAAANSGNALMNAGNARASAYGGAATSANQGIQNYLLYNALGNSGGGGFATYANGSWTPGAQGFPG